MDHPMIAPSSIVPLDRFRILVNRVHMCIQIGNVVLLKTTCDEMKFLRHYVPENRRAWASNEYEKAKLDLGLMQSYSK